MNAVLCVRPANLATFPSYLAELDDVRVPDQLKPFAAASVVPTIWLWTAWAVLPMSCTYLGSRSTQKVTISSWDVHISADNQNCFLQMWLDEKGSSISLHA